MNTLDGYTYYERRPYEMLRDAIIKQAVSDLIALELKRLRKNNSKNVMQHGYRSFAELERFFNSKYCAMLCESLDPLEIKQAALDHALSMYIAKRQRMGGPFLVKTH